MGLTGPFPCTVTVESEEEGWLLLSAITHLKRTSEWAAHRDATTKMKLLETLYTRVLMACGDD